MPSRKPIILIGFMGVGKSSVAEAIGRLCSYSVAESDDIVLERSGYKSIAEIFKEKGEEWFRELEHQVLCDLLKNPSAVISTGGGVIESERNRALLQSSGASLVHLMANFETICERIGDPSSRPLFQDDEAAKTRYVKREPLYRETADFHVLTEGRSPEEIARVVALVCGIDGGALKEELSLCAVIGDPIAQSQSPRIHTAAFAAQNKTRQRAFVGCRVRAEALPPFMERFRGVPEWRGLAVTIPHKVVVLSFCDQIDETAEKIGAVNTVVKQGGKVVGFNTDWEGISRPIQDRMTIAGARALVIGSGGTARAALYALLSHGAKTTLANRSIEKGKALAQQFEVSFQELSELKDLVPYDIVVQTTSVGMGTQETLFRRDQFRKGQVLLDAVYHPEWTRFLLEGEAAGAISISGREMFLAQAEAQYEIHWGESPRKGSMAIA